MNAIRMLKTSIRTLERILVMAIFGLVSFEGFTRQFGLLTATVRFGASLDLEAARLKSRESIFDCTKQIIEPLHSNFLFYKFCHDAFIRSWLRVALALQRFQSVGYSPSRGCQPQLSVTDQERGNSPMAASELCKFSTGPRSQHHGRTSTNADQGSAC